MKIALIRFKRYNDEDRDSAQANFGNMDDLDALVAQFRRELGQNETLNGLWQVIEVVQYDQDTAHPALRDQLAVLVTLKHDYVESKDLIAELQRTYDEHGMNGLFEVLLTNTLSGPICSRLQKPTFKAESN